MKLNEREREEGKEGSAMTDIGRNEMSEWE